MSTTLFAFAATLALLSAQNQETPDAPKEAGTYEGLAFRSIGPALMSGRISDIAVHPTKTSTWYVAVGSGGVWKTVNAGTTWTPIFDDQTSYSIGCIAIDPNDPATVWVGTGENVSGRHVGYGDGLYRSTDGGATWEQRGLAASEHIGSISIRPGDSNEIVVAAQGPLWSGGGERGVYRTTDGGETWTRVLSAGEFTGANEVVRDPSDPDVLYAAMHQRLRTVGALMNGGPESGIHKSTDGGETWAKLEGGLPSGHVAKIGLAVSPVDSDVVYATIEEGERKGGFWRSTDGGASWTKRNDYLSGGTGPHYYQEIFASPHDVDRVYQMDVRLHVTEDGGESFHRLKYDAKHSDNHALAFDADDEDHLIVGCDGGLYETFDRGETWRFFANLPVTQFYKVSVDDAAPFYNVYGGTQDNNTQGGPSRTLDANGITNDDWEVLLFGDGHDTATEPGNPNIVYVEWQEGNLVRHDRATGEIVYVKPQPSISEPEERQNWDSPILVSPHDPARVYFASQRVWRSDDRGGSWRAISGDLTRDIDRFGEEIMGQTWGAEAAWDTYAMSRFSTITSLAESPAEEGVLWAGTDDGRLQVTRDGGANWTSIDYLPGVPEKYFVNDVKADRFSPGTAYVVVDDHKHGDYSPYVLKTKDYGATWESITANLPERHVCWRIEQDHQDSFLLFLGTEFGVYFTCDGGASWHPLGGGMPTIPVRDLAIQERENDLVAATFGRGFYVLDDYSLLRGMNDELLAEPVHLFPARDALWYIPRRPLGGAAPMGRGSQGNGYYIAPNPDFGATFTYHVAEDYVTQQQSRLDAEKESGVSKHAGFEKLHEESYEHEPRVVLSVWDSTDNIVARVTGPATKGFHRVSWNLRYPSVDAWRRDANLDEWDDGSDDGALCAPGTYTVRLGVMIAGGLIEMGQPQEFHVVPLGGGTLPAADPAEVSMFRRRLDAVWRRHSAAVARVDEQLEKIRAIRAVLPRTPNIDPSFHGMTIDLERRLDNLRRELVGDDMLENANEPGPMSLQKRLDVADLGTKFSTFGPTPSHEDALQLALSGVEVIENDLTVIKNEEFPQIDNLLDRANAPWTPGR